LGPGEELLPGHPRLAESDIHEDKYNTLKGTAHGDLVSRDEIIDAVWPGTTVEDGNLNFQA